MKRLVVLPIIILFLLFNSLPVFSGQIEPRPKGKDIWGMYDANGDFVGTLKRTEQGNFSFYDKGGKYIGLIFRRSGKWVPWNAKKHRTIINPEDASLYLDALSVVETIKSEE